MVESVQLFVVVGDDQVEASISIEVARIDPHASLLGSIESDRGHRLHGDVLEGSVFLVLEEKVVADIVGQVDVRPAIVVEVADGDAHSPFGAGLRVAGYAGAPADIFKGAVAIVSEQGVVYRCVLSGGAIAGSVVIEAGLARGEVDLAVIADVEIEVSIPVIVEKAGAGAEARGIDSGLGGNLRKGEAFFCAVVAVEMVSPEARDIDVKVAI